LRCLNLECGGLTAAFLIGPCVCLWAKIIHDGKSIGLELFDRQSKTLVLLFAQTMKPSTTVILGTGENAVMDGLWWTYSTGKV